MTQQAARVHGGKEEKSGLDRRIPLAESGGIDRSFVSRPIEFQPKLARFAAWPATLCHRDFGQFADYPRSRILIARYRDRRFTDTIACRTCKQGEGHLHVRGGMPYTLKHARDTRPLGRPPVMVARFCTWPEGAPLRISLELE